jgi:Transcriptional regulator, AbiEi antitoxin
VVTLGQLKLAGLTASSVRDRIAAGRLYPIHRGVYAVGHDRLTGYGRTMAAVLAYGPQAVASYRTAGGLQGLRADNSAKTDVSLPRRSVHLPAGHQRPRHPHAQPS